MIRILQLIKEQMELSVDPQGTYVDFTMGNGHDTLFLSRLVPEGRVFSFDIQAQAIASTRALLEQNGVENVTLIHDSHEAFEQYYDGELSGGMFNLGYLPGGDHSVTTLCEVTIRTLQRALKKLKLGGVIAIAVYPGHEEGAKEGEELGAYLAELPKYYYDCFMGRLINIPHCPYVYIIERKRSEA